MKLIILALLICSLVLASDGVPNSQAICLMGCMLKSNDKKLCEKMCIRVKSLSDSEFRSYYPRSFSRPSYRRPSYGNYRRPSYRTSRRPSYGNYRRPSYGNYRRQNYGNYRRPNYGMNRYQRRPNYGMNRYQRRPNYGMYRRPNYGMHRYNRYQRRPNYGMDRYNRYNRRRPNYGMDRYNRYNRRRPSGDRRRPSGDRRRKDGDRRRKEKPKKKKDGKKPKDGEKPKKKKDGKKPKDGEKPKKKKDDKKPKDEDKEEKPKHEDNEEKPKHEEEPKPKDEEPKPKDEEPKPKEEEKPKENTDGKINQAGVNLIKEREGWYSCKYNDPVGLPTIGYGHLIKPGEVFDHCLSRQEGEDLLRKELNEFERCISKRVKVPLNSNQFSALVSFSFNVGCGNFESSTLLRMLNQGDYSAVCPQLARWNKGGGKVLPGLTIRRQMECDLFRS